MPRLLAAECRMITPTTLKFIWWKLIIPTLHPQFLEALYDKFRIKSTTFGLTLHNLLQLLNSVVKKRVEQSA